MATRSEYLYFQADGSPYRAWTSPIPIRLQIPPADPFAVAVVNGPTRSVHGAPFRAKLRARWLADPENVNRNAEVGRLLGWIDAEAAFQGRDPARLREAALAFAARLNRGLGASEETT